MNSVNVQITQMDVSDEGDAATRSTADPAHRRPTIKDVARAAGVSHATVTRTLNAVDAVSPATRARVLEAIVRTGWTRDEAAAALGGRKNNPPAT
jgi:hypothetical protein